MARGTVIAHGLTLKSKGAKRPALMNKPKNVNAARKALDTSLGSGQASIGAGVRKRRK